MNSITTNKISNVSITARLPHAYTIRVNGVLSMLAARSMNKSSAIVTRLRNQLPPMSANPSPFAIH